MATGMGMGAGTGIIKALVLSWHCMALRCMVWYGMVWYGMALYFTLLYCDTRNNTTPNYSVWRYAALEMKLERLVGSKSYVLTQ